MKILCISSGRRRILIDLGVARLWKMLQRRYLDAGISDKIALLNCLIFSLLVAFILTVHWAATRRAAINYAVQNAQQRNAIVTEKLNHLIENAEDMSSILYYNDNIQKKLRETSPMERLAREYSISHVMNSVEENSAGIGSILIFPREGGIICTTRVNLDKIDPEKYRLQQRAMEEKWDRLDWLDMHLVDYHVFNADRAAITLRRNIISIYTGEIVALLTIDISEPRIAETYSQELCGEPGGASNLLVLNRDGVVVSSADKSLLLRPAGELGPAAPLPGSADLERLEGGGAALLRVGGEKYLVSVARVDRLDWRVVRLDALREVYRDSWAVLAVSGAAGAVALLLAALAARSVAGVLTRPILELGRIMDEPEERMLYQDYPAPEGGDEIGRLSRSFQRMRQRMRVLIERVKFEQQQKMHLNLLTLQTQINPHFLYNTLESVCALLQLGRIEDATQMLKSVEMFYRGTLSRGSAVISIRDELYVARQYLLIQRYRYDGELRVEFRVSEEVMDCGIPKLTLQPILENAIYHGLKNGGRDGAILVEERHDAETVVLTITDDGDGFNQPRPEEIPKSQKRRGGFGLQNTQNRIRAYFGEAYGLQVESALGKGTAVSVRIPNRKRDDGANG